MYIDGALRGHVWVDTPTIDWRPRHARKAKSLSWERFAELMEEHSS